MVAESGSIFFAVLVFLAGFGFGRLSARRGSLSPARRASAPRSSTAGSSTSAPLNDEAIDAAIHGGHKVEAIRRYRELSGADLITAEQAVEQRATQLGKKL